MHRHHVEVPCQELPGQHRLQETATAYSDTTTRISRNGQRRAFRVSCCTRPILGCGSRGGYREAPRSFPDTVRSYAEPEPACELDNAAACCARPGSTSRCRCPPTACRTPHEPVGASPLTGREAEVLAEAGGGDTTEEIGSRLALSATTVRNYLSNAIGKLGARNRIDAIRIARDAGWL